MCKNNAFCRFFFAHIEINLLPLHSEMQLFLTFYPKKCEEKVGIKEKKIELKNNLFNKKKINYV